MKRLLFSLILALPLSAQARFDYQVRNDFFAGFAGNKEALARAMKTCDDILTREDDPHYAEALVWHGAGTFFMSGQQFQAGDTTTGQQLWDKGLQEMDGAVKRAPENPGVRIPRGAVLLTASHNVPPQMAPPLIQRGIEDFESAMKLQEPVFEKLGAHPRGELMLGLASGYARTAQNQKARSLFERIRQTLPGTPYAASAEKWLSTGSLTARESGCLGCHTGK